MRKPVAKGKWIAASSGSWETQLGTGSLVQFVTPGKGTPLGAIFCDGPGWEAGLSAAWAESGLVASDCVAKLIVSPAREKALRESLISRGLTVAKVVSRTSDCLVKFDSASGKLLLEAEPARAAPVVVPIRVLIVDDSPTIRRILEKIFAGDPEMVVVGSVGLPSEVAAAIEKGRPDVITLDIHLPEMNGVELLKQYLPRYPIPTVMISSISAEEGPLVLNALEAGAVDYIQKPGASEIKAVSPFLLLKVKTASRVRLRQRVVGIAKRVSLSDGRLDLDKIVAIGSSTGGTEALKEVFLRLPESIPPMVVVQHIPAVFSKAFADRMNELCPFEVVEGVDGMELAPSRIIIAPGGRQMSVVRRGAGLAVSVVDSEPVNRHKPSVDVLMNSVASLCGSNAVGVILTGMGADGARGLLAMQEAGAATLGQDEASCVVYGMPMAAKKLQPSLEMVPLQRIAEVVVGRLKRRARVS